MRNAAAAEALERLGAMDSCADMVVVCAIAGNPARDDLGRQGAAAGPSRHSRTLTWNYFDHE